LNVLALFQSVYSVALLNKYIMHFKFGKLFHEQHQKTLEQKETIASIAEASWLQ